MHGKQIMFIVMENVPCKTKIVLLLHLCKVGWYFTKDIFSVVFWMLFEPNQGSLSPTYSLGWVSLKKQECISAASEVVLPWCNGRCCSGVQGIILEHRRP